MDRIGAVWRGREPHSEYIPMDVFETTSGKKYAASLIWLTDNEFQVEALKFNFVANDRSASRVPQ
jgi:hypothetical protein